MEIVWSPESLKDLEEIGTFISEGGNTLRAHTFVDELLNSVERLKKFPESGMITDENAIFRQVVYDGYRLIYHLSPTRIAIITIIGPG